MEPAGTVTAAAAMSISQPRDRPTRRRRPAPGLLPLAAYRTLDRPSTQRHETRMVAIKHMRTGSYDRRRQTSQRDAHGFTILAARGSIDRRAASSGSNYGRNIERIQRKIDSGLSAGFARSERFFHRRKHGSVSVYEFGCPERLGPSLVETLSIVRERRGRTPSDLRDCALRRTVSNEPKIMRPCASMS
jgi:hypothetical protein